METRSTYPLVIQKPNFPSSDLVMFRVICSTCCCSNWLASASGGPGGTATPGGGRTAPGGGNDAPGGGNVTPGGGRSTAGGGGWACTPHSQQQHTLSSTTQNVHDICKRIELLRFPLGSRSDLLGCTSSCSWLPRLSHAMLPAVPQSQHCSDQRLNLRPPNAGHPPMLLIFSAWRPCWASL